MPSDSEPKLRFEVFAERVRGLGFERSDETLRQMWRALPRLDAMRERVRRRFEPADEPASVFRAGPSR